MTQYESRSLANRQRPDPSNRTILILSAQRLSCYPLWLYSWKANDLIVLIIHECFWASGGYALGPLPHSGRIESSAGNEPSRSWHHLGRGQDTLSDETPGGSNADLKPLGGLCKADHAVIDTTSFRDAEAFAHCADADCCPGFSVARLAAHAIKRDCDVAIAPSIGELPDRINNSAWPVGAQQPA